MPKLIAPTPHPIILAPARPNAGIIVSYQQKLAQLVKQMHLDILAHIAAAYSERESEITQDASPAVFLREVMRKLAARWMKRIAVFAPELAEYFTHKTLAQSDVALKYELKRKLFAVPFEPTRAMNNTLTACISEQVGLIKSIPSKYFTEIEQLVMRSVSQGGNLKQLSDALQERYGVTKKRAAFIASDQNRKAFASINRRRTLDLGITQAVWRHSHAGRIPRPSHVAFDGKIYDIAKGAYIDGEWILPGQLINCRCVACSVIPKNK